MIDVLAALDLAIAASKTENPAQLFDDAKRLYSAYQQSKAGNFDVRKLPAADLKADVEAAARLTGVANSLVAEPSHMATLANLLASL